MSKKILVVGCGMSQMPTLNAIRQMEHIAIGVDGNPSACGIYLAHQFEKADIKDLDAVLKIAKKYKVDGIIVPGTDFPDTGAYVAEEMDLPGIPRDVAKLCTNKYAQKIFLKAKGFLVPEIRLIENGGDLTNLIWGKNGIDPPYVIKPIDNMAARGSKKMKGEGAFFEGNLNRAYENALKFSQSKKVVIEKFEEGIELSVDSLVYEGEVFVFAVADRHFDLDPYFIEIGHTQPSILNEEIIEEVKKVFIDAVKALGITHGSAKGDLKISKKGIMILEIAARISGGVLSGWTVPFSTGYSPHQDLVSIHLGEKPKFLPSKKLGHSAERVFLSIPGKLKEIQRFNLTQSVCPFVHFHIKPGDKLNFPLHNAERCGSVVSYALDRNSSIEMAKNLVKDTLLRLEPSNKETEKFLNSSSGFKMFETIKKETDWCGNDMEEALEKVNIATEGKVNKCIDIPKFWDYFYKGGIQGAVYFCDTYK